MTERFVSRVLVIVLALLIPSVAMSAALKGAVSNDKGEAVRGAIVTLKAENGLYSESVYTDDSGGFQLETEQQGILSLRVRKPYFADDVRQIDRTSSETKQERIVLRPLESVQEVSDSLSASAHFSKIQFDDPKLLKFFKLDCLSCHQIGTVYTRAPRTSEQWRTIVTRMVGFLAEENEQTIERYVSALENAFDGTPLNVQQKHNLDSEILGSRIREWKLPEGMIAHDTEVNIADGLFYTVDQGKDQFYITNPKTNITEVIRLPAMGVPQGGKFMELYGDPNPVGLSVRHGPHSLQLGLDGRFYTTNAIGGSIGALDPVSRKFEVYPVGGKGMYPHTLRIDRQGLIWFTLSVSNQVASFDPVKNEMRLIDLPDTKIREDGPKGFPYGIDINPIDGSIWYSRLYANKIGRIDPLTLAVVEYDPPLIGPRRLRFSADGILWIPAFSDSALVRLDPVTMKYTNYPMPLLSPKETEAPYAVAINPQTQEVWVTANMSDRVFRFLPGEERFITYPLPTRGTYLREFFFPADGSVCAPSSPVPAIETVVEGGMQALLCIEPGKQ